MVLEATMICVDNSEWMRNGDYSPTRFQAQADAVNLICGAKTQSNPENTVGVLTMAGKGVRVLVTPTSDLGKILACMHGLDIGGEMNLAAGIQVAQLALKHRQNKKQQQRIIVFAGGPIKYDKKVLEMIGRKLKKNSVALDVVNFGEEDDAKTEKLEALVAAVNNNDSSHIVHVPPGASALSDVLISTPIFTGDEHRLLLESEEVIRIKNEHPDERHCIVNDRVKGRLKVTRAFEESDCHSVRSIHHSCNEAMIRSSMTWIFRNYLFALQWIELV